MKDIPTINNLSFETFTPPNSITFHNGGSEVGRLEFTKEGMKFTGKADESAKVFFDNYLKGLVDDYIKDLLRKEDR